MAEVNAPEIMTFKQKLQERCEGLFYMSESEYPLEPLILDVPDATALTQEAILKLVGQGATSPLEIVDLPYFLRHQTADVPDAEEFILEMIQKFRALQAYLQEQLQEVKVYRIGQVEVQVYALGKLDRTHLAGFKTVSVET